MLEETFLSLQFSTKLCKTSTLSGMLEPSDYKMTPTTLSDQWTFKTSQKWKDLLLLSLKNTETLFRTLPKILIQQNGQNNHSWLPKTQLILLWWKLTSQLNNTQHWLMKLLKKELLLLAIVWLTLWLMFITTQHLSTKLKASKKLKKYSWNMLKLMKGNYKNLLNMKVTSIFNLNDESFWK